jgi:hypothetical protein
MSLIIAQNEALVSLINNKLTLPEVKYPKDHMRYCHCYMSDIFISEAIEPTENKLCIDYFFGLPPQNLWFYFQPKDKHNYQSARANYVIWLVEGKIYLHCWFDIWYGVWIILWWVFTKCVIFVPIRKMAISLEQSFNIGSYGK